MEKEPNSRETGGRIIVMPDDPEIRQKLERKAIEYGQRVSRDDVELQRHPENLPYTAPEILKERQLDSEFKLAVAKKLLNEGRVDVSALESHLRDIYGNIFDLHIFERAIGVICDYLETGGKHTKGGTGFKK